MADIIQLMEKNLVEVWNQRDPELRLEAIKSLYNENTFLNEMGQETIDYESINRQVDNLLKSFPEEFEFTLQNPVSYNKNMGRLSWTLGEKEKDAVQNGMDVAIFEGGRIKSLYVFMEKKE